LLHDKGDLRQSEELWRAGAAAVREAMPEDSWYIALFEASLGRCLLAQGRFAEAEPLLVNNVSTFAKDAGIDNQKELLLCLIELYDAWGKPARAAQYRERLASLSES
jgi:hypothetical protein